MATNHTNNTATKQEKPSALEKFNLAFEYDRTWNEAKHSVQLRPGKNN